MHIVIDGRMIANTGVGRVIQNLIISLVKLEQNHHYTLLVNPGTIEWLGNNGTPVKMIRRKIPLYSFKEQCYLPIELLKCKPDLVYFPNFNVPLFQTYPSVITVNDLVYYLFPEATPSKIGHLYAKFIIKKSCMLAQRVITISQFSKSDLEKHAGVPGEKIVVIYPGVDNAFFSPISDKSILEKAKAKYNIAKPFIFYVGNHEPRKNLVRLMEAYSRTKSRKDYQLVIGGKIDTRRIELRHADDKFRLYEDVIFTGQIPDEDLAHLYNAADLFAFPSLYEGFGLPPLEAMACGTPVVCSNATSLPEVVGNAGIMVNPMIVEEISQAMDRVLSNTSLQEILKKRGLDRAAQFSWEKTARQTLAVYESCSK